jgi:secondary thiamine-phosphate synthase enzyme
MKWKSIDLKSNARIELIDITNRVFEELKNTGIQFGTCFVFTQHTTAGLIINENADPDIKRDLIAGLARLAPQIGDYQHFEGNSDAHIKASLMGFSLTIPIIDGRLALGTWQGLYFCEFDGPRHRQILVGITGE